MRLGYIAYSKYLINNCRKKKTQTMKKKKMKRRRRKKRKAKGRQEREVRRRSHYIYEFIWHNFYDSWRKDGMKVENLPEM